MSDETTMPAEGQTTPAPEPTQAPSAPTPGTEENK
jgi:hypothetical protein